VSLGPHGGESFTPSIETKEWSSSSSHFYFSWPTTNLPSSHDSGSRCTTALLHGRSRAAQPFLSVVVHRIDTSSGLFIPLLLLAEDDERLDGLLDALAGEG